MKRRTLSVIRRNSSTSDDSFEMKYPSTTPSNQSSNDLTETTTNQSRKLVRQNTFVLEERITSENEDVSLDDGGVSTILDLLPDNLKPYISMHFKMIKEENADLLELLEEKDRRLEDLKEEHDKCVDNDKALLKVRKNSEKLTSQYEREKSKTKALMKQLKLSNNLKPPGGDNNELIWYGVSEINQASITEQDKDVRGEFKETDEKQSLVSLRKESEKASHVDSSSQTVDSLSSTKEKERDLLHLLEKKEILFENLIEEHDKCQENERASAKLKRDFERLSCQYASIMREKRQAKSAKRRCENRSSQTSENKDSEKEPKVDDILLQLEEKDQMFKNLKKKHDLCLENEKALAQMKLELEKITSKYEREKNKTKSAMNQNESTIFQAIGSAASKNNEENKNEMDKAKPYISQIESLKTEMESLRKVRTYFSISN